MRRFQLKCSLNQVTACQIRQRDCRRFGVKNINHDDKQSRNFCRRKDESETHSENFAEIEIWKQSLEEFLGPKLQTSEAAVRVVQVDISSKCVCLINFVQVRGRTINYFSVICKHFNKSGSVFFAVIANMSPNKSNFSKFNRIFVMAQRFQIFAESLKMSEPPRQPRQPKDLPGLLKFCMEATGKQLCKCHSR